MVGIPNGYEREGERERRGTGGRGGGEKERERDVCMEVISFGSFICCFHS